MVAQLEPAGLSNAPGRGEPRFQSQVLPLAGLGLALYSTRDKTKVVTGVVDPFTVQDAFKVGGGGEVGDAPPQPVRKARKGRETMSQTDRLPFENMQSLLYTVTLLVLTNLTASRLLLSLDFHGWDRGERCWAAARSRTKERPGELLKSHQKDFRNQGPEKGKKNALIAKRLGADVKNYELCEMPQADRPVLRDGVYITMQRFQ